MIFKKIKSAIFFIFFSTILTSAHADIPTIKAIGGEGTNIHWLDIKKREESTAGPGFFPNHCGQSVEVIKTSSALPSQGQFKYDGTNLNDNNPLTAWVEGRPGYGIGEYFEVKQYHVNTIYNGYQYSPSSWKNNSRVKKFKVYVNNMPLAYLELTDEMGSQKFNLPNHLKFYDKIPVYKFEIVEVYKGLKYADVAISHVDFIGCCFSKNTTIQGNSKSFSISKIKNGQKIHLVNINSGTVSNTKIVSTTKQKHLTLLKISTSTKQIEITPDHPLYVKNYGFISISKILKIKGLTNYNKLINTIELLTWNSKTSKLEYEKPNRIKLINGFFNTYNIVKLSKGTNFIANGFVTKIY